MTGFRHLGERDVHHGYVWKVVVADYEAPDGTTFSRDIVRSPGAVGVVPLVFDAEGSPSVVLVSQYRPPFDRDVLEIPAGMRDVVDEPPTETARRELIEEAGLDPGALHHLVDIMPSAGMTDSITMVYMATDCAVVARNLHGPEEEHMTVVHLPLADAITMIEDGAITDAKTVAGLLMADRRIRAADQSAE